jgi:hypothetical protein
LVGVLGKLREIFAPSLKLRQAWVTVEVVGVSVVLVVGASAMTGVPTTVAGGRWSGTVRMCLRPLPTLLGLLALEIAGKRLLEILSYVDRRLILLLVVLVSPLVTNL